MELAPKHRGSLLGVLRCGNLLCRHVSYYSTAQYLWSYFYGQVFAKFLQKKTFATDSYRFCALPVSIHAARGRSTNERDFVMKANDLLCSLSCTSKRPSCLRGKLSLAHIYSSTGLVMAIACAQKVSHLFGSRSHAGEEKDHIKDG